MSRVSMDPVKCWIDDRQVDSAERSITTNSAAGGAITEVASSDEAEINAAVTAAKVAFPVWVSTPAKQCIKLMRQLGELIEQNMSHLVVLETMDTNLPVAQTSKQSVPRTSKNFHFFAEMYTQVNGHTYPVDDQMLNYMLYQPVGVCALISSWNVPFMTATWKMASCLTLGNTVVLGISELPPLIAGQLGRLALETGTSPDMLNVVQGYGATIGDALVHYPDVRVASFTDGMTIGKRIMEHADLKRFPMELGGELPVLIFDDADLGRAPDASLFAILSISGERYTAGSRIFMQENACDDFVRKFAEHIKWLVVGDPADKATHVGSMITRMHWEKAIGYIHLSRQEGTKILTGGAEKPADLPGHLQNGNLVAPTVLTNIDNHIRVAQEEIFGSMACLIPFKDEADGLRPANDAEYGPALYIWMQDMGKVHRVARGIEAGIVFVNSQNVHDLWQPFGGVKASGTGRESGEYGLGVFAEIKSVCISMGSHHIPRWGV